MFRAAAVVVFALVLLQPHLAAVQPPWELVVGEGFGDFGNDAAGAMTVFLQRLYLATAN